MDNLSGVIITGCVSLVVAVLGLIGVIISEISTIHKLDQHMGFGKGEASLKNQLDRKIGVDEKSLKTQLGVQDKSVTEQLGVQSKSVTEQLGVQSKSVTEQLGVQSKSVTEQLGVGTDDKSLTGQHKELLSHIISQSDSVNGIIRKIDEEKIRRQSMTLSQQEISRNVNALIEQWEESVTKCVRLEEEVAVCRQQIASLEEENARLKAENQSKDNGEDNPPEFEP